MAVTIPAVICLIPILLFYQLFLQPSWHLGVFVVSVKHKNTKRLFINKKFIHSYYTVEPLPEEIHGAVVAVIVWQLDLQLPMQSMCITTDVVSSNLNQGEVYNIM